MNLDMEHEYFEVDNFINKINCNAGCIPPKLYPQSLDWTCSLACIRSIASGIIDIPDDKILVNRYNLQPGPKYSPLIKQLGILDYDNIEVIYGCDIDNGLKDASTLWYYLHNGYRLMIDWLLSCDHWTVILNYIQSGFTSDTDYDTIVYYDPYCNEIKSVRVAHISVMWQNLDNTNIKDFIAVKEKQ